jgi:hypothetical protein
MRLLIKLPNAVRKEFEIFVNRARDKEKLSLPIKKNPVRAKDMTMVAERPKERYQNMVQAIRFKVFDFTATILFLN